MARISGTDLPNQKRIEIALQYIYGVGPALADRICTKSKINPDKRAKDLTEAEIAAIRNVLNDMQVPVEGELRRVVTQNIRRLQEISSYRGTRHKHGLPARGQRTRTNARTKKGKKKTVGGLKIKLAKK